MNLNLDLNPSIKQLLKKKVEDSSLTGNSNPARSGTIILMTDPDPLIINFCNISSNSL